jgi:thiamine pyrophosphate-dependent acetolactate synthase large subunit-like protein
MAGRHRALAQVDEWTAPATADTTPIHPQRAAHEIDKALPDDAILVSDVVSITTGCSSLPSENSIP